MRSCSNPHLHWAFSLPDEQNSLGLVKGCLITEPYNTKGTYHLHAQLSLHSQIRKVTHNCFLGKRFYLAPVLPKQISLQSQSPNFDF